MARDVWNHRGVIEGFYYKMMNTESIERDVHHCWSIPSWCGVSNGKKSVFLDPYITLTGETYHIYINYCLKNTLTLNECTTIFIVILYCKNDLVWLMISSTFSLFFLQVLEKLNLEVLDFRVFSELAILELFLTWRFKHLLCVRIFKGVGILVWLYDQIVYA